MRYCMGAGNGTGRYATDQNTIRYLRNACWLHKATNTHLEYIIIIALSRQQSVRERALLLHYTFIDCLAALTAFCLGTKVLISQHFTEHIGFLRTYQLDPPPLSPAYYCPELNSQVMNLFTQFVDFMDWESDYCKVM